tara:strand:- start:10587 stop:12218 length:1632 start_codon:yes stop_codon:yes gene_type:complete
MTTNDTNTVKGIYNTSAFDGSIITDFISQGDLSPRIKANRIDYSAAEFPEFRKALLEYMKAVYPEDYNSFAESDLGMMMVELFAYMGTVLSYKADMLANENFITSVQAPENLRKLLQLIGVSMRGPISSKSGCTLTLDDGDILTGSNEISITPANRSFSVVSNKDSGQLTFTIYPVDGTGAVDMESETLTLAVADSLNTDGKVFSNLILIEGQLKTQTGVFSNTDTIHTIKLTDPSIVEGSLILHTDGVIYNEIENLFLADSTDRVFSKTYTDDYSVKLNFGDDIRGKSPTAGKSYTVYYRVGGGDRGNIVSETLNVKIPALIETSAVSVHVTNPTKATGGLKSETAEHAKKWGPYFFKTQYRAVTGEDYTAFANHFTSQAGQSGKAFAILRNSGAGGNMIDIYTVAFAAEVAGQQSQVERASIAYKRELLTYLNKYKMITDELTIVDGLVRTVDLKCTLFLDVPQKLYEEDIKRKAAKNILEFFDLNNRDFGEVMHVNDLNKVIFNIPEVRFSSIDNIKDNISLNFNEILQLNNIEINVKYV